MRKLTVAAGLACLATAVPAQPTGIGPGDLAELSEIRIDVDNFVRAATDIEIGKYLSMSGGVNQFFHVREPTPLDQQPTIRMNRDTLYSMVVADISKGATLTLPEVGKRYMSAQIVNQDHYSNDVFLGGGSYNLDMATFDTPYVIVIIRILVDASDPADLETVHGLQEEMKVEAASNNPFVLQNYDKETFDGVLKASLSLARFTPDSTATFGAKESVDPLRHFLGTAFGWGGLPEKEAYYLNVEPNLPVGEYKIEAGADIPVGAFWSVSLYNARGFFEKNDRGAYIVNSVNGILNDDGTMTIHLGGCDDDRVNCLPIMDGWNYTVRLYRPGPEILDGSWTFPGPEPVN